MAEANTNNELEDKTSAASRTTRRFRFDKADRAKAEGSGILSSLLGDFGVLGRKAQSKKPTHVPERRATDRVHQLECKAWVGWKTFRGFSMNNALLVDISRGGARIFLDKAPPALHPVWIYLETPLKQASVRARVVVAEQTQQAQCMLRIEFEEHCPYEFFEAAVCGQTASDPKTRQGGNEGQKANQGSRELAG